jgi:hypothetical protein
MPRMANSNVQRQMFMGSCPPRLPRRKGIPYHCEDRSACNPACAPRDSGQAKNRGRLTEQWRYLIIKSINKLNYLFKKDIFTNIKAIKATESAPSTGHQPRHLPAETGAYRITGNTILLLIFNEINNYSTRIDTFSRQTPGSLHPAKKIFRPTFEYTKITRSRYISNIKTLHSSARKWRKSRQSIVVDSPRRRGRNE